MYAVSHGGQLEYQSGRREGDDGKPVVLGAVFDVNMADLAEAERHARDNQHHCHADGGNTEAGQERSPHELGAQHELPAHLQVEGEGANETPDYDEPSTEQE